MRRPHGILVCCLGISTLSAFAASHPNGTSNLSCDRNISFAVAENGAINARVPDVLQKWLAKNAKKYPTFCFSQTLSSTLPNYVFVLATSQTAFSGLTPSVQRTTNTDVTPTSGSGTVTNNYGETWNYTYTGTVSTQTTTCLLYTSDAADDLLCV